MKGWIMTTRNAEVSHPATLISVDVVAPIDTRGCTCGRWHQYETVLRFVALDLPAGVHKAVEVCDEEAILGYIRSLGRPYLVRFANGDVAEWCNTSERPQRWHTR